MYVSKINVGSVFDYNVGVLSVQNIMILESFTTEVYIANIACIVRLYNHIIMAYIYIPRNKKLQNFHSI